MDINHDGDRPGGVHLRHRVDRTRQSGTHHFGCCLILLFATLRLVTEVHSDAVHIRFAPMRAKRIPYDNIASMEVRTIRPIRDFGGWGVRHGKSAKGYLARGNQAVWLSTLDGRDIVIGTEQPDQFESALRTWLPT